MDARPAGSPPDSHPMDDPPHTKAPPVAENHTYGQILKSSALIGGSSVLTIAVGIVRTKAIAVLLGPTGIGLIGMYGAILDLGLSIAGMGVSSSGVRQIAEAVGSGETDRIARTVIVLRRTSLVLGILGAALLAIFSKQVAVVTFGSTVRNDRLTASASSIRNSR